MIYSCFNQSLGLYEYYEDDRGHPINGDLPVPTAGTEAGQVGVPAMDAGRHLPGGVKRAGTGWYARGVIVQCDNMAVRGLVGLGQDLTATAKAYPFVFFAGGALAVYGLFQLYINSMQQWGRR